MISSTDLAALLCSRLCHDLTSPVGAIGNGLELLAGETDPQMRLNCIELLEQSARSSAVKLQFYRFAFGAPAGLGETVSGAQPRALLEALLADKGGIVLEWAVAEPQLDSTAMKMLLNFAALGVAALVRGGTLAVGAETHDGNTEIVVRASGPRIAFDPAIGTALEGGPEAEHGLSHAAPALLIRQLAEERGGSVQHAVSADALLMGAVVPARMAADLPVAAPAA